MSATDTDPVEVFISYSHKDEALRKQLGTHLSVLKRQRVIDEWHDRCIGAGQEWAGAIDEHLNSAAVILLLVSPDFLASEYCYDREMTRALQRHNAGEARVIPVILRTSLWEGAPFARLQALPENGRAITSWTDRDKALTDVARGLDRAVQQIRAVQAAAERVGRPTQRLPLIWNVPSLRNPHFTDRKALLDELHQKLMRSPVALTAVRGMGGVGKTQLALEYAYRHAGEFDLVWWLRAEEPSTLLEGYAALAALLGLAQEGVRELAVRADAVCRELARRERWLLVFDNASHQEDVKGLIPRAGGGCVLITSRSRTWPFAVTLDVPTLDVPSSIEFLLARTGQGDEAAAKALAEELGHLPLALELAAASVAKTGLELATYVDVFRTSRRTVGALA